VGGLQEPAPGVSLEGVRPPDVADHSPRIPVAGLVHNPGQVRAPFGRRRDVAGPQAVCPERRSIETSGYAVPLDEVGHGLRRQTRLNRAFASLANPPPIGKSAGTPDRTRCQPRRAIRVPRPRAG
jgi:hypothetical protein